MKRLENDVRFLFSWKHDFFEHPVRGLTVKIFVGMSGFAGKATDS